MKFKLLVESKQDDERFKQWIAKELNTSIDSEQVDDIFKKFSSAKQANRFSDGDMSGYYYWVNKRPISDLLDELDRIDNNLSNSQQRKLNKSGAKLIYNKDGWKGYFVTTYEAMKYLGSGTQWCVAGSKRWVDDDPDVDDSETQGRDHFESQLRGKGYYVLISPNKITWEVEDDNGEINEFSGVEKYCIRDEVFDVYDVEDNELDYRDCPDQVEDFLIEIQPDSQMTKNAVKTGNWIYDGSEISKFAKKFITNITILDSVTSIGYAAFYCCRSLSKITIPNSVTTIGYRAFEACSSLENITIPNSVTSIGDEAFYQCENLEKIIIPNSVTSIGDYAFDDCSSLSSITIPNSITAIGRGAFHACSELSSITIPNSITAIGYWAFNGCSELSGITIPDSVMSIGECAFAWCEKLTNIQIPNSVTSIGVQAFFMCKKLEKINIPDSVTTIGYRAFDECSNLTVHTKNPIAIDYCKKNNIKYVEK